LKHVGMLKEQICNKVKNKAKQKDQIDEKKV